MRLHTTTHCTIYRTMYRTAQHSTAHMGGTDRPAAARSLRCASLLPLLCTDALCVLLELERLSRAATDEPRYGPSLLAEALLAVRGRPCPCPAAGGGALLATPQPSEQALSGNPSYIHIISASRNTILDHLHVAAITAPRYHQLQSVCHWGGVASLTCWLARTAPAFCTHPDEEGPPPNSLAAGS